MDRPTLVLPTPGGPTKHRIGPCNAATCLLFKSITFIKGVVDNDVCKSNLERRFELSDSQILQDASLQFVHSVVVVVQKSASSSDVQTVCRVEEFSGQTSHT